MELKQRVAPLTAASDTEPGASRGQILILFALFLLGMMGVLGLATDVGMAFAQRRTMQSAADAGALAGARQVARWTAADPTVADPDVAAMVAANRMDTEPVVELCEYVDYDGDSRGACTLTVPEGATGVSVRVTETHDTFFIRIVPGAPDTVTVSAQATAHVQRFAGSAAGGPFIICGFSAWDVTDNPNGKGKNAGGNSDILLTQDPPVINPTAVGRTFRVHDPQLDSKGNADCSSKADRFKGLADQDKNEGKTAPDWFYYDTGNKSGPTRAKVYGTKGCNPDTDDPYNCVMFIPIATNNPAEQGNSKQVYVVAFAAFEVTTVDSNTHNAKLIDDFITLGPGSDDWCRDCGGIVVIRLTS